MIKVSGSGNEPLEKILKRFKKKCEKEGLIKDIKRSSYYEKPSERRRREGRERRKAIRLAMRARRQDVAKLLSRRRKARKSARAAQRADDGPDSQQQGDVPLVPPGPCEFRARRGTVGSIPTRS